VQAGADDTADRARPVHHPAHAAFSRRSVLA
jgi:hypothetical protein